MTGREHRYRCDYICKVKSIVTSKVIRKIGTVEYGIRWEEEEERGARYIWRGSTGAPKIYIYMI